MWWDGLGEVLSGVSAMSVCYGLGVIRTLLVSKSMVSRWLVMVTLSRVWFYFVGGCMSGGWLLV